MGGFGSGKVSHLRMTTRSFISEVACLDIFQLLKHRSISELGTIVWKDADPEEFIRISGTPVGYGVRSWLVCPRCGRNVRRLYSKNGIACRKCHQLVYPAQNKSLADRLVDKRRKIWKKLGGHYGFGDFARPKGMRHRTFRNLVQEDRELELLAYRAYLASAENFADLGY